MTKDDNSFSRRELLAQAKRRGITVKRGTPDAEIDAAIQAKFSEDYQAIWDADLGAQPGKPSGGAA